jgi:hypothetical protein
MNPITEKPTDTHLRFNKLIDSSDNTLNSRFQTRFLQPPCQGCGSADHPLLSLVSSTVHCDDIKYDYTCPVVDRTPLYSSDFNGIKILYSLGARSYAEHYNYNLDEASTKDILRANHQRQTRPECFDTFLNDVRRFCLQHEEMVKQQNEPKIQSIPTVPIITRSLTNKRKLEEMEYKSQREKYSTPVKRAENSSKTNPSTGSIQDWKRSRRDSTNKVDK